MEYLLKEIDVFVKVVELGSFKAAAEDLSLTQSAMTQRLKKLEEALGVRLVDRTTRRVSPTAVGQSFLPVAKRLLIQFEQSIDDLRNVIEAKTGQVTIASLISVATYVLPSALKIFSADHPHVGVRIVDDAEQEIAAHVARGEAEFGIDMRTPTLNPALAATALLDDRYVLACRRGDPLARRRRVAWEELGQLPLITLGSRSGTSRLLLARIEGRHRSPNWRYEVQHLSTLLGLVEQGLGVGIAPAMAIGGAKLSSLVALPLVRPDFRRTLVLLQRRGVELSPAAKSLRTVLLATFRAARQNA